MDTRQIRYFLSLAETLNFTLAAQQHDISQPALTKAVMRLEDEIGGILVHRDGKHTRLTELGRRIRSEFEQIANAEERAKEIAWSHLTRGISQLRLGIANSLGPRHFVDFISKFTEAHPNVTMTLHQVDLDTTQEQILSGSLDACFCTKPLKPNHKIKSTHLFTEQLMIAMSENHPLVAKESITLEDLAAHPYFDRLNCEFRPSFVEMIGQLGIELDVTLQSNREDWIQQIISHGHGLGSLPEFSQVVPGIVLRPLEDCELKRDVSLITILGSTACTSVPQMEKMAECYDWDAITKV